MHHVVQITWHVAVLASTYLYVAIFARGSLIISVIDPEESSVLLATPTREHVKFVGDVLHVTLLHVSFVPFIYRTSYEYIHVDAIIDSLWCNNGRGLHFSAFSFTVVLTHAPLLPLPGTHTYMCVLIRY